ncbi:MAG: hypothetical protein GC134_08685 [Proteobacteria bacterium]|nr:hypothetical protein [Pseudomonadota bacterium]
MQVLDILTNALPPFWGELTIEHIYWYFLALYGSYAFGKIVNRKHYIVIRPSSIDWSKMQTESLLSVCYSHAGREHREEVFYFGRRVPDDEIVLRLVANQSVTAVTESSRAHAAIMTLFLTIIGLLMSTWLSYGYEMIIPIICAVLYVYVAFQPAMEQSKSAQQSTNRLASNLHRALLKRLPFHDKEGRAPPKWRSIFRFFWLVCFASVFVIFFLLQSSAPFCPDSSEQERVSGKVTGYVKTYISPDNPRKRLKDPYYLPELILANGAQMHVTDGYSSFPRYPIGAQVEVLSCKQRLIAIDRGILNYAVPAAILIGYLLFVFLMITELNASLRARDKGL